MKLTRRRKRVLLIAGLGLALLALAWALPFARLGAAIARWEAECGPLADQTGGPATIAETNASALELEKLGSAMGLCLAPRATGRWRDCRRGAPDPEPWLSRALAIPNRSLPAGDSAVEAWLQENRTVLDAAREHLLQGEPPEWAFRPWDPFDRSRHGREALPQLQQPDLFPLGAWLAVDALVQHREGRTDAALAQVRALGVLIQLASRTGNGWVFSGVRLEHLRLATLRKVPSAGALEEATRPMPDFQAAAEAGWRRSCEVLVSAATDAERWEAWRDWEDSVSSGLLGSGRWPAALEPVRGALAVADALDDQRRLHAWRRQLRCGDSWSQPSGFSTGGWQPPWWTSQVEGGLSAFHLHQARVLADLPLERDLTRAVLEAELHRSRSGEWPREGPVLLSGGRDCPGASLRWLRAGEDRARLEVEPSDSASSPFSLVYRGGVPPLERWEFGP